VEVKRVERLNISQAMEQSVRDSKGLAVPFIAHRKNREEWMITVRAVDLLAFIDCVNRSTPSHAQSDCSDNEQLDQA
jgi:hypothetical protein